MNLIILWSLNLILIISLFVLKKNVKLFSIFLLTFFVTLFSLFTPNGKIIFKIFNFSFTSGALFDGLFKSGILILMQLFSRLVISAKIKFPGRIGKFITEVFLIYEKLSSTNSVKNINSKNENLNFQNSIKNTADKNSFKENSSLKNSSTKKSIFQKINFNNLISLIDEKLFSI